MIVVVIAAVLIAIVAIVIGVVFVVIVAGIIGSSGGAGDKGRFFKSHGFFLLNFIQPLEIAHYKKKSNSHSAEHGTQFVK